MNILLIYPSELDDIELKAVRAASFMGKKALFAPHALAAIAALTPENYDVTIFDEAVHGHVENKLKDKKYELIGIHFTTNQLRRCLKIAEHVREYYKYSYLIAGGIGLASISKDKLDVFQTVFYGEAEETWAEFLSDFEKGNPKPKYRKLSYPNMNDVPIPKWDLIKEDLKYYATVSVQTTRGCPYDCNFCNVVYTYGRKMRCKSVDQVIEEVKLLESLGVISIFFADDNFIGNRKFVKEILQKLILVNNSFTLPLIFITQLDITVANDDELLQLLADCNFVQLMIGIETVNPKTLQEMNKLQNLNVNIPEAIRKIQSYGIAVTAHMIVGFDNDTVESFKHAEQFINENAITEYLLHPLMAPLGTKLWYQMKHDSRVIDHELINEDFTDIVSNIIPKNMTRTELMTGMLDFWERMDTEESIVKRALAFFDGIARIPNVKKSNFKALWKLRKLIFKTMGYFMAKADKKDKEAYLQIFKMVRSKSMVLMSRFMYIYTNYFINRYRAQLYSDILKQQLQIESNDPSAIVTLDNGTPIPENVISYLNDIFNETYLVLRKSLDKQARLYNSALETITDFINLFGAEFVDFDEFQKRNLHTCAARVINNSRAIIDEELTHYYENELPLNNPPAGFFKQMYNSLDFNLRFTGTD